MVPKHCRPFIHCCIRHGPKERLSSFWLNYKELVLSYLSGRWRGVRWHPWLQVTSLLDQVWAWMEATYGRKKEGIGRKTLRWCVNWTVALLGGWEFGSNPRDYKNQVYIFTLLLLAKKKKSNDACNNFQVLEFPFGCCNIWQSECNPSRARTEARKGAIATLLRPCFDAK
jgi:hypothetical protein